MQYAVCFISARQRNLLQVVDSRPLILLHARLIVTLNLALPDNSTLSLQYCDDDSATLIVGIDCLAAIQLRS